MFRRQFSRDSKRIYDFYLKNENSVVLGSRRFENEVPKRSRFGNDVSRNLLRICLNKHLYDTQTGLRAFSSNLLDFMINIKGSRFEYEMNMLSETIINDINIHELSIETIYIDENKGSHFRPVRDFIRITSNIIKYKLTFFFTIIIDILFFILFCGLLKDKSEIYYIHASLFSSLASVIANVFLNYSSKLHGDKRIFTNRGKMLKKLIFGIITIGLNFGLLMLFRLFMDNLYVIRVITNIIIVLLFIPINYFISEKSDISNE